ncbi:hypothetical protein JL721_2821 [Aureococcus anophagefferens]|nr:hypothetical protein JL721_2821 [Aureococcus anophagefferens]
MARSFYLACLTLAVADSAAFSPMNSFAAFKANTGRLVDEQKVANAHRKRRKEGELLDYPSFDAIQCANADRLAEKEKQRRTGLNRLLGKIDKEASSPKKHRKPYDLTEPDVAAAVAALSAKNKQAAVAALAARPGAPLPEAALLAASLSLDGPYRFLPRWMHKGAVKKGVTLLTEGDAALRISDIAGLPAPCLENACVARGLLKPTKAEMERGSPSGSAVDKADGLRGRGQALALAVNTVASIREGAVAKEPGVALLYAGKGF